MSALPNSNPATNRIGAIETGTLIWQRAAASADWLGGALAGEFAQKQTVGQIVFDAILSMFPIFGEGTAARDAIAICLAMAKDHRKADDRGQWLKLVLCLLAVVPVAGGVIKGVGKLAVRALEQGEDLSKLAHEIILFLNRMGHGNAYEWLRQLDFTRYQGTVRDGLEQLIDRLIRASQYIVEHLGGVLPPAVRQYLSSLPPQLEQVRRLGRTMVPQALQDLNEYLVHIRAKMVEGTWIDVVIGPAKTVTYEDEGRLASVARDGEQVPHPNAVLESYPHREGWPDLRKGRNVETTDDGVERYITIESFSSDQPIVADTICPGRTTLARVLDSTDREWNKSGALSPKTKRSNYWLPRLPRNGQEWREHWAVVQDWNHNGSFIELTHIPTADELRAVGVQVPPDWEGLRVWRGQVSSQYDAELGRHLAGGETQWVIDFSHPHNAVLEHYIKTLTAQPTRWTDAMFVPNERVAVIPMGPGETAPKTVPQGYITRIPAMASRAVPDRTNANQQR
jgi:hypothetical protein